MWEGPIRTLASARAPPGSFRRADDALGALEQGDLHLVPDAEFLESKRLEREPAEPGELQLVLDPDFL